MLVLSRKQGERLHIGDEIVVTVLEVKGRRVRIGIEAPEHLRVVRGELRDRDPLPAPRKRRPVGGNKMGVADDVPEACDPCGAGELGAASEPRETVLVV